jgi:hypothetical protein
MPPLRDEEHLDAYKKVLAEWQFTGYIVFEKNPSEWIRENLSNCTQRDMARLMFEHRDEVDQTKETREPYRNEYSHHYDFRIRIGDMRVYIETVLDYYDDDDSTIRVVRVKPA